MPFSSLYPSSKSSPSISSASQSSALVKVLGSCELSVASYPLSMNTFVDCLRAHPISAALYVTTFESFVDYTPRSTVVRATKGFFGHQYNAFAVLLPDGRKTYIRVDYRAKPPPGATSSLTVCLSDDHGTLTEISQLNSRITVPPGPPAAPGASPQLPTLAALASLFAVAVERLVTRPYCVVGHNCIWMTEMLFYTPAQRYAALMLAAGSLMPEEPLQRFLRGEAGVLDTVTACAIPNEAVRQVGRQIGRKLRAVQVAFAPDRKYAMHDEEVIEWLRDWEKVERTTPSAHYVL